MGWVAVGVNADEQGFEVVCIVVEEGVGAGDAGQGLGAGVGAAGVAEEDEVWVVLIGEVERFVIVVGECEVAAYGEGVFWEEEVGVDLRCGRLAGE